MEEETSVNVDNRYTDPITGKFIEGNPGGGRPPETPEAKVQKKVVAELIKEYKEALADILPDLIPIMREKAVKGDIQFIKEVGDRVLGKPEQKTDITSAGRPIIQLAPEVAAKNEINPSSESDS